MAGVVVPRDSANTLRRSTNVTTTGVLPYSERMKSNGPTRKAGSGKQRVTQFDSQFITAPGAGSLIPVPSGSWLVSIDVLGNWDDINAGFTYSLGDDDITYGAWVAHRPDDTAEASGHLLAIPVTGGTVTPAVVVGGSGEGDVSVLVRFDPCEAP